MGLPVPQPPLTQHSHPGRLSTEPTPAHERQLEAHDCQRAEMVQGGRRLRRHGETHSWSWAAVKGPEGQPAEEAPWDRAAGNSVLGQIRVGVLRRQLEEEHTLGACVLVTDRCSDFTCPQSVYEHQRHQHKQCPSEAPP